MQTSKDHRTEMVVIRLTPLEKLRLMQRANKAPYKGNVSALVRDLVIKGAIASAVAEPLPDELPTPAADDMTNGNQS